jgi:phytoene dehydrogenase-like protein
MKVRDKWLVVGGGFRGIVGSYLLAKRGRDVVVLERGKELGGVLNSAEWNGYCLDKGCHLFDNDSNAETSIALELMQQAYIPINVVYASVTNGTKTDGIAIPDLQAFGEDRARDMLYEVTRASTDAGVCESSGNLREVLDRRFGTTAGNMLGEAARKMYQIDIEELDASGFRLTPFNRVKIVDYEMAQVLKQSPLLDEKIAASSQGDPLKFYRDKAGKYPFRNFYPNKSGMRGFCESASRCLDEQGVRVLMDCGLKDLQFGASGARAVLSNGEILEVDNVLWAAGIEPLAQFLGLEALVGRCLHQVSMVIYYYMFAKGLEGEYTYQRNYDPQDLFFTASLPGKYGPGTCPEGYSYACCEVPTHVGSPQWEDPEASTRRIWEELVRYGMVTGGEPEHTLAFKVPKTYKMPKVGFGTLVDAIWEKIGRESPIIGVEDWEFSKNDIIRDIELIIDPPDSGGD